MNHSVESFGRLRCEGVRLVVATHGNERVSWRRKVVNEPGCVAWPARGRSVNNAEEYFSNDRKDSDSFRVSIIRIEEMDRDIRVENRGIAFSSIHACSQITNSTICFYILQNNFTRVRSVSNDNFVTIIDRNNNNRSKIDGRSIICQLSRL